MFTGRLGRLQYFLGQLVASLVTGVVVIVIMLLLNLHLGLAGRIFSLFALAVYACYTFVLLGLIMRRMHDIEWSGWWVLSLFIPIVSFIVALILLFKPGKKGANRFGKPPKPGLELGYVLLNS